MKKKWIYLALFSILLCACQTPTIDLGRLAIYTIDVGDSDALLIELPTDQTILIDGGSGSTDAAKVETLLNQLTISHIDFVIATHFDHNHVGALNNLLMNTALSFGGVFMPNDPRYDRDIEALREVIHLRRFPFEYLHAGDVLIKEPFLTLEVLSPSDRFYSLEADTYSLVIKMTYHEQVFLLMGDAEISTEETLISTYGSALNADWIKLAKHGGNDANSSAFLTLVSPQYAVVSNGNTPPAFEVINDLFILGTSIYQTQQLGTLVTLSDGTSIVVNPLINS